MGMLEASIIHHVGIVFLVLWLLSCYDCCDLVTYLVSFFYLYLVHERYEMRLRRKLQFEERRHANQSRVLSDSETVRWLNLAIEKIWPVCMEQIVSQKILLPIIPWFLQKYKPWTAKEAVIQHLYLGRSPPMFTEMRVVRQSTNDDHLVLELGMNFHTGDDMSALLAVKLRRRLGFGMWAKLHLTSMHIEGKVLVGVKFLPGWPFLGRLRVCFVEPPYFQMTVKPIINHGLNVTDLPGIAGWVDKILAVAFEQTLVQPNMLVVDMEKFAAPQPENWFSVDEKEPIAYGIVEVVEGADLKPSNLNGLADPYLKGKLGPYRFRTKTQKKTLAPKWHEEFKIPIFSWDSPNVLTFEVRDKDRFVDDILGDCSIDFSEYRDGQRHDMWLSLQNIKMGRLHLVITVVEGNGKADQLGEHETTNNDYERNSCTSKTAQRDSFSSGSPEHPNVTEIFEPIDIDGQQEIGMWVHQPGSEVSQIWEPRKRKNRLVGTKIHAEDSSPIESFRSMGSGSNHNDSGSSNDESLEANKGHRMSSVRKGMHRIRAVFHRSHKKDNKSSSTGEPLRSPVHSPVPSPNADIRVANRLQVTALVSSPNSCSADSCKPKEHAQQIPSGPVVNNIEDTSKKRSSEGLDRLADRPLNNSEENGERLVKSSSNPKNSEENLGGKR